MARLKTCGFEWNLGGTSTTPDFDGGSGLTTLSYDTGTVRTGTYAAKFDSGASNIAGRTTWSFTSVASRSYFLRAYMRFPALPSSTAEILGFGDPARLAVRLKTTGELEAYNHTTATVLATSSQQLSVDTWYRIEAKIITNGSNQWTDIEVMLDGVSVASGSGQTETQTGTVQAGWVSAPGANKVVYVDDVGFNDSTGSVNNTWPGSGNVVAMFPVSDNNRGNWTAGAGGTTSLFDGVNNKPPVGVADASATNTSQIKIKSTSLPSNCDLNCDTYTNAGVTGTVNALHLYANHGEDPATGTKAGTIEIVSNPAAGPSGSFNFGNDAGAQGTYPGLWVWVSLAVVEAPTVTLGTAPVIRVTCTSGSTATRAASCDALGMNVDYTPAAATAVFYKPEVALQAVNRAGTY